MYTCSVHFLFKKPNSLQKPITNAQNISRSSCYIPKYDSHRSVKKFQTRRNNDAQRHHFHPENTIHFQFSSQSKDFNRRWFKQGSFVWLQTWFTEFCSYQLVWSFWAWVWASGSGLFGVRWRFRWFRRNWWFRG